MVSQKQHIFSSDAVMNFLLGRWMSWECCSGWIGLNLETGARW